MWKAQCQAILYFYPFFIPQPYTHYSHKQFMCRDCTYIFTPYVSSFMNIYPTNQPTNLLSPPTTTTSHMLLHNLVYFLIILKFIIIIIMITNAFVVHACLKAIRHIVSSFNYNQIIIYIHLFRGWRNERRSNIIALTFAQYWQSLLMINN